MYALRQIVLLVLIGLAPLTGALAQDVVGSITDGAGEILVIRSGNEQAASVGTEIQQYDEVYVGEDGEATITFVDDTLLTLSGGSAMTIDEFVYDPSSQANSGLFTLAGGVIGLVSGDMLKTGDMTVTTPVSTIGIRGTTVLIDSGTSVRRIQGGGYSVTTTTQTGETVTLVLSRDGTLGLVTVTNASGQSTTLRVFGDTVTTTTVNGGAIQLKSTLTPADLNAKYGNTLRALRRATGKDLGDPANAVLRDNLQNFLEDVIDDIEDDPSPQ